MTNDLFHKGTSRLLAVLWGTALLLAGCTEMGNDTSGEAGGAGDTTVTLGQLQSRFDPGFALTERVALTDRCRQKQNERLAACETMSGDEQASCVEEAQQKLALCDYLDVGNENDQVILAGIFCDGICALQQCSVANPCNLGKDVDGDGKNDVCVAGARCANEGMVCDPGVLFDCTCTTTYYPKNIIRPLARCECNCE